jgi:hypothetical protein
VLGERDEIREWMLTFAPPGSLNTRIHVTQCYFRCALFCVPFRHVEPSVRGFSHVVERFDSSFLGYLVVLACSSNREWPTKLQGQNVEPFNLNWSHILKW